MNKVTKLIWAVMIAAFGMLSFAGNVSATPITAEFSKFSVLHQGSNPSGSGDRGDWFRFDSGQTLDLDLNGTLLELTSPQSFSMSSNNGQGTVLELLGFSMDLNDTDGFLGGTIDYVLGTTAGQFTFVNKNYTSLFNSSSLNNGVFSLFIWGGDHVNDLGLDAGLTAQVPEPGILLLLLTGLGVLRLLKRFS